ncbi:hypothetical protein ONZ45_g11363 [Pleurotus djamor]|nr:hypothetical protein ONZ45_g11363 [Pleurotus djamor]
MNKLSKLAIAHLQDKQPLSGPYAACKSCAAAWSAGSANKEENTLTQASSTSTNGSHKPTSTASEAHPPHSPHADYLQPELAFLDQVLLEASRLQHTVVCTALALQDLHDVAQRGIPPNVTEKTKELSRELFGAIFRFDREALHSDAMPA